MTGIVVIDHGQSNMHSILRALRFLGITHVLTSDPGDLEGASHMILPGVGAFGEAMARLNENGMTGAIREQARRGARLLGICLGMQLLFERSAESPGVAGLGLIPGEVLPLRPHVALKVPHVGWNSTSLAPGVVAPFPDFARLACESPFAYFVHSFYCAPRDAGDVVARTTYAGFQFCSMVRHENIYGVQFHPELSDMRGVHLVRQYAAV